MKFVPGAAASCMKTDIAQTEGILQARQKNGAKTEHQKITIVKREMTEPGLILCQTVI
jgi:hypothetical protein